MRRIKRQKWWFLIGMIPSLGGALLLLAQERITNPHGPLRFDCQVCHTPEGWHTLRPFDHNRTSFPLQGAHTQILCTACHTNLIFSPTPNQCAQCHTDIHQGSLGFQCQTCHTPLSWENRFQFTDNHNQTRFPLIGPHAGLDCEACHNQPGPFQFANTPLDCIGCHQRDFQESRNPDHVAAGFGTDCTTCHGGMPSSWREDVVYEHPKVFPLEGAHREVSCEGCHEQGYKGIGTACVGCHAEDYGGVEDPPHEGFPEDCGVCHGVEGWRPVEGFDHKRWVGWPLEGAHEGLDCGICHSRGYAGTPGECVGCHERSYRLAPGHVALGYPEECGLCHTTVDWGTDWRHDQTGFPLTGAHADLLCSSCHSEGYTGTPADCFSCHQDNYNNAPNHLAQGYPMECQICHTTTSWGTSWNHDQTGFPLTGAHANLQCSQCHVQGYRGTPADCFSCHQDDYNNATNPDHIAAGFHTTCQACHSTTAWTPANWNHQEQTGFPLEGQHANTPCSSCHSQGYAGTPADCYACHQEDYNNSSDPPHLAMGFPTDCQICHTPQNWESNWNHDQTGFPLTGAHANLPCIACHANGYENTPSDCFSCHQDNYNSAPNHASQGYPHDCTICHTTHNWNTNWNHDQLYFPIYSGEHEGEWNVCSDCHIDNNFNIFECIFCHEHNQQKMDKVHSGVPGYVYESQACYQCHPNGEGILRGNWRKW